MKQLKIIEPKMCEECRFHYKKIILIDENEKVVNFCKRKDCDNHCNESKEPVTR